MKGKEGSGDQRGPDAKSGRYSSRHELCPSRRGVCLSGSGLCPSGEKGFFADVLEPIVQRQFCEF